MNTPGFDILQDIDIEITRITVKNQVEGILRIQNHNKIDRVIGVKNDNPVGKKTKKNHSIFDTLIFFVKYISTTAAIFVALMITTNYQAYYQIVKSYVYADQIAANEQGLIQSVQAASGEEVGVNIIGDESRKQKYESEQDPATRGTLYAMDTLTNKTIGETAQLDIEITPYENRIIIPKIGKNIPLVEVTEPLVGNEKELNDIFMEDLENGVVRYPSSVKPGEDGNTFIFGHSSNFPWIKGNYNEVFALLDKVSYGDDIIIYYEQKKYVYRIREKSVIDPKNVGVIKKAALKPRLTLMTCWPIGTTLNRLIVAGELIEETDL